MLFVVYLWWEGERCEMRGSGNLLEKFSRPSQARFEHRSRLRCEAANCPSIECSARHWSEAVLEVQQATKTPQCADWRAICHGALNGDWLTLPLQKLGRGNRRIIFCFLICIRWQRLFLWWIVVTSQSFQNYQIVLYIRQRYWEFLQISGKILNRHSICIALESIIHPLKKEVAENDNLFWKSLHYRLPFQAKR